MIEVELCYNLIMASNFTHGTDSGYRNHGCRCDPCKEAGRAYNALRWRARKDTFDPTDPSLQHGKTSYLYTLGCRCEPCTVLGQARNKAQRERVKGKKQRGDTPSEGICACCGEFSNQLRYDHDHETGLFRDYICTRCNTGLGKLGDSVEGLERALKYLRRFS